MSLGMNTKRRLYRALAVGAVLFIFGNSLLPARQSHGGSGMVLEFAASVLGGLGLPFSLSEHLIRKSAHFLEFFLLGVFLTKALGFHNLKVFRSVCLDLSLCLLVAAADETIQAFVPGRSSKAADVLLDLAGAAAGMLSCMLFSRLLSRAKRPER